MVKQAVAKVAEQIPDLHERLELIRRVLGKLDGTDEGKLFFTTLYSVKKAIDDSWHLQSDPKVLEELRINKLAVEMILNTFSLFKNDEKMISKALDEMQDQKQFAKDYDLE